MTGLLQPAASPTSAGLWLCPSAAPPQCPTTAARHRAPGALDAITSWFDEEVVLEDVPTGHVARGSEEARTFVSGALKMAPGASYEVISVLADGDRFAAEWVMRPAGLHGASVGTVRNGKVATNRDFWDASPLKK